MALPAIPNNFCVQQGNQQVYLSWDLTTGATGYSVQRSTDGVTFSVVNTPTNPEYLDTSVTIGTQYWYKVASVNATGTSGYTSSQSTVPTPTGEMSLGQIRLNAQQRADRQNSEFVTKPEWNSYINQSMFELYDLLITLFEDQYVASPCIFNTNGSTFLYPMPNGSNHFIDQNGADFIPEPFYKLIGVDLAVTSSNNAWVTINKFNFIDRNRYVYPNSSSTIYGVFNLQYRLLGSNVEFIPTPTANQQVRLWYVPRLRQLLKDIDLTTTSVSGWIEYVIVDAAIKALQKEESDVSVLMAQKMALKARIEESAANRDAGQPDRISDVRMNGMWGSGGGGWNGPIGGF